MDTNKLWNTVCDDLRGSLSASEFETWIAPLTLSVEDGQAIITAPNRFFVNWVSEHFIEQLRGSLRRRSDVPLQIRFSIESKPLENTYQRSAEPAPPRPSGRDTNLTGDFRFENFVLGPCNELALAACQSVAAQPGRQYNPLMVFGGPGLGKTHLIHAIGNALAERDPSARILYSTCEAFTNELIQAVRFDGMGFFQDKYRNLDCLLLDDVQYLSGREKTQEELFHTLNALLENGSQIVLTSDEAPRELAGLSKRLRSRLEGGLLADLQAPPPDVMKAILQSKALSKGMDLSDQVASFLAGQPESNVRVLEGYLNRIVAVSRFQGAEVTLELARRVVGPLISQRQVTVDEVLQTVAARYGVRVSELKSSRKTRDVTRPRQVAMYLARQLTGQSYPEIGKALGNKDHSTVVKGVKKIQGQMAREAALADEIRVLERELMEGGGVPVD